MASSFGRPPSDLIPTMQTNSQWLMKIPKVFSPLASKYAITSFYESDFIPCWEILRVVRISCSVRGEHMIGTSVLSLLENC